MKTQPKLDAHHIVISSILRIKTFMKMKTVLHYECGIILYLFSLFLCRQLHITLVWNLETKWLKIQTKTLKACLKYTFLKYKITFLSSSFLLQTSSQETWHGRIDKFGGGFVFVLPFIFLRIVGNDLWMSFLHSNPDERRKNMLTLRANRKGTHR